MSSPALVVVAHPRPDAFCHELARRVTSGLEAAGHHVDVVDLAALGFRAAMSPEERAAYHGEQPMLDPMVAEHARLVTEAEIVVFVYPTWWSGLPALLKGWLERVFVPGVGFRFHERSGKVRPNLTGVRHLIGVSTYGSPRTYVRLVNDNGRRTILRTLRMACGWRTRTRWFGLYSIDTSTHEQRIEFAAKVEQAMADLR